MPKTTVIANNYEIAVATRFVNDITNKLYYIWLIACKSDGNNLVLTGNIIRITVQ